jgi:hypothetical protein
LGRLASNTSAPLATLIWPGDRKKVSRRPLPSLTVCSLEFRLPFVRAIVRARSPLFPGSPPSGELPGGCCRSSACLLLSLGEPSHGRCERTHPSATNEQRDRRASFAACRQLARSATASRCEERGGCRSAPADHPLGPCREAGKVRPKSLHLLLAQPELFAHATLQGRAA